MKDMKLSCATVPKNKIIVPKYNTDAWSHQSLVEYQGCQKLAENRSGEKEIAAIWPRKYKTKSELTIYEYYGNTGNELAKIPTDAEIISYAQNGIQGEETTNLYVEYNQIKGWIKTGYNDIEYIEDLNIDDLKLEVEETKEDDLIDTTEKQATTTGKITDYVVTCVIIGLSIAVIALIILLIINKRKYKALKNDETKQLQK